MSGVRRARTSFDFYEDQSKEDYEQTMSQFAPPHGHQSALSPRLVRPCSPLLERQSRSRARSVRPSMTPRSQTLLCPDAMMPSDDLYNIETDNPYAKPMDPINKQYYYKQWTRNPPQPMPPIYREGRLGSPWRHIKACINNSGNHLVFIDGTIKSDENHFYPPESLEPPNFSLYVSPRLPPPRRSLTQVPMTYREPRSNIYNERAKEGFKYWSLHKKPIDLASRYRQKAKMLTLGASCSN